MKKLLAHYLFPHTKNNHRAKLLHNSTLVIVIAILFFSSLFLIHERKTHPDILGISYSISTEELLFLTNQKRAENGLPPLSLNPELSSAASAKASNMFSNNYWAHFAPDGTSPWYFIKQSGYNYVYAGENLAKGFTTSGETVNAWMNSPSHRDNVLNKNYSDVGFAIVEGNLLGEDTVLVVELFGSSNTPSFAAEPQSSSVNTAPISVPVQVNEVRGEQEEKVFESQVPVKDAQRLVKVKPENNIFLSEVIKKPFINLQVISGTVTVFIMLAFLFVLILDLAVVEKKKIPRIVGHNIDHITLIGLFILLLLIEKGGGILGV